MSVRYYCDGCEKPIPAARLDKGRIKGDRSVKRNGELTYTRIGVEVMTSVNGTWNGGHLCWECIVRVVEAEGRGTSGPVEVAT